MIGSLKNVDAINGKKIVVMDELRTKYPDKFNESGQMDYRWFEEEIRPNHDIYLRHDVDSLTFNMMTKPASEGGKGCQLTDLITTSLVMLRYFNEKFPCRENSITITKLEEALMWQKKRTEDRESRGVEGKNLA
jgi:hypothetical protein